MNDASAGRTTFGRTLVNSKMTSRYRLTPCPDRDVAISGGAEC
jgi:hypothetical protein